MVRRLTKMAPLQLQLQAADAGRRVEIDEQGVAVSAQSAGAAAAHNARRADQTPIPRSLSVGYMTISATQQ